MADLQTNISFLTKAKELISKKITVAQLNEYVKLEKQQLKQLNFCDYAELRYLFMHIQNLDANAVYLLQSREYYNPAFLQEITCLINSLYQDDKQLFNVKVTYVDNLYQTAKIAIYKAEYGSLLFVVKEAYNKQVDKLLYHEALIGFYMNNLRAYCPNFIYTYGIYKTYLQLNKDKQSFTVLNSKNNHLLTEYINKSTYPTTLNDFIDIYMQILYALEIAQHHYKFVHYDLHYNNVVLRESKEAQNITYKRPNNETRVITSKYIATIIDYGFSYILVNREEYGRIDLQHGGIEVKFNSLFDVYKLTLSLLSMYKRKANYQEIENKLIQVIRLFNTSDPIEQILLFQKGLKFAFLGETTINLSQLIDSIEDIWQLNYSTYSPDKQFITDMHRFLRLDIIRDIDNLQDYYLFDNKEFVDEDKLADNVTISYHKLQDELTVMLNNIKNLPNDTQSIVINYLRALALLSRALFLNQALQYYYLTHAGNLSLKSAIVLLAFSLYTLQHKIDNLLNKVDTTQANWLTLNLKILKGNTVEVNLLPYLEI